MTLLALWLGCSAAPVPSLAPSAELKIPGRTQPTWPQVGAVLRAPPQEFPSGFGRRRVYIDPGHGVGDNRGALSAWCVHEQTANLRAARHLAAWLEDSGHFEVKLSRSDHDGPPYTARHEEAAAWGAEVLLGLHADSRGAEGSWAPWPGADCPRGKGTPGFSVLWSDEGAPGLVRSRKLLARGLAGQLARTGITPYDGSDYTGLYLFDEVPGTFIDRRGLAMLRRPSTPAVIVETHHALDPEEWSRWQEAATLDAFSASIAAALVAYFAP